MNAPDFTMPWPDDEELLSIGRRKWAEDRARASRDKAMAAFGRVQKTMNALANQPEPDDLLCAQLAEDAVALRLANADRCAAALALAQLKADPQVEHV